MFEDKGYQSKRPIWLPDIKLETSQGASLFGVGSFAANFTKGTWFSNIFDFWLWFVSEVNASAGSTALTVSLDLDINSPNYKKITLNYVGGGFFNFMNIPDEVAELSGTAGFLSLNAGDNVFDNPIQAFVPTFQVADYIKGYEAANSYSVKTVNGSSFSQRQHSLETRAISSLLCRFDNDRAELDDWLWLHNNRWRNGRAVTFYLDRDNSMVFGNTQRDILKLVDAGRYQLSRLIEAKHAVSETGAIKYHVKKDFPGQYYTVTGTTEYQVLDPPFTFFYDPEDSDRLLELA